MTLPTPAAPPPLPDPPADPTPVWREYASAIVIVAVTTALCFALRSRLKTVDVAMVLLLGVVAVAALYRRGPRRAGLGTQHRGLRLRLRAAVLHLRRSRHGVLPHLRRHARRSAGDERPHRPHPGAAGGG